MSHFSVAVFSRPEQDVDEMLAPFDENLGMPLKYNEDVDEDGNEWSTYNPKSKWDWYEVGGRWGGLLENKSGNRINHSVVSDIIFPPDFTTYAVLLPDGTWHEPGKMLYFGVSAASEEDEKNWDENYYKNFIEKADPNWILTIVDCHI